MNILLANLASPANPGDQAIFRGTLKLFRRNYPDASFTVLTRAYSEKAAYEKLGCKAVPSYPNVECLGTDQVWKKIANIPRALLQPGPVAEAVRQSDAVFLIGGAYFYSYRTSLPGLTYLAHFSAIAWARFYKKPVIFLPQSYGPFASPVSQQLFRWAVESADFVFYREHLTGEWLAKNYPAHLKKMGFMPDLALYLSAQDFPAQSESPMNQKAYGVTIRAWKTAQGDAGQYLNRLAPAMVQLYRKHGLKARVIVQVQDPKKGEGDEWISEKLTTAVNELAKDSVCELQTKQPYFSLDEICALYAENRFLIGMRLHSGLLSFIIGRPALITGYQHKAEGILKALSLQDLYLGSFDHLEAPALIRSCEKLLDQDQVWARTIEQSLNHARGQIEEAYNTHIKPVLA